MKTPQTLRRRMAVYYFTYFGVLLCVYSLALHQSTTEVQDLAFNRQIAKEAQSIVQHVEEQRSLPPRLPLHMTAYRRLEDVPPRLREHIDPDRLGVKEINAEGLDYHLAVSEIPSTGETLYLFYDTGAIEISESSERALGLTLIVIAVAFLLVGWLLAHVLAKRILRPVTKLAESVRTLSPDREDSSLAAYEAPDEIGTLAKTIDNLLQRSAEFTRREREFTAHASHELRTPATVIKGAVEILRSRIDADDAQRLEPLARIERSVADIEVLIDTFLLLARHDKTAPRDEACCLQCTVDDVVAAHRYLLEGKPVVVEVEHLDSEPVHAPTPTVSIAVGNLVRNAFQHTREGRVEVTTGTGYVSVRDTGPGLSAADGDAGIGLTIVRRLCERLEWSFTIEPGPEGGTRAELHFQPPRAGPERASA